MSAYRAVVFDLGGVVFPSPIDVMRAYEAECELPDRFLSTAVLADPDGGAWARMERGELTVSGFVPAFEIECAAAGYEVDAAELMERIGEFAPRVEMLDAIALLRDEGLRVAALTNNWVDAERPYPTDLDPLFDVVVESAKVGVRKPDPRIYELVCEALDAPASACVFLDDMGANLKPARAMGMATIKVTDPATALAELGTLLGLDLRR